MVAELTILDVCEGPGYAPDVIVPERFKINHRVPVLNCLKMAARLKLWTLLCCLFSLFFEQISSMPLVIFLS